MPARTYEPFREKHKRPKGFGSLCPEPFDLAVAQALLEAAIEVVGNGDKLWAASGRWVFCAQPTRIEENVWHGYPVIGGDVDDNVLIALERAELISRHEKRVLRRQRALPDSFP